MRDGDSKDAAEAEIRRFSGGSKVRAAYLITTGEQGDHGGETCFLMRCFALGVEKNWQQDVFYSEFMQTESMGGRPIARPE